MARLYGRPKATLVQMDGRHAALCAQERLAEGEVVHVRTRTGMQLTGEIISSRSTASGIFLYCVEVHRLREAGS